MRTLLVVLLLLTALLAGCSDEPNDGAKATSSSSTSHSATKSATATGTSASSTSTAPKANHPPTAGLAIANVTGTLPLNVTFALTGTDSDGDALSWSLAFGDNATAGTGAKLPANVTHSYTAAGNYTAKLTVRDAKSNATAQVTVTVTAGNGTGNSIPETYTFTGTATGAHDPALTGEGTGDPISHKFAVFGPVKSMTVTVAWEVPGADLDLVVNGPGGTERGSSGCANFAPAPFPLASCNRGMDEQVVLALAGTADAGEWEAVINPFNAPQMEYTLTVTFT